MKLKRFYSIYFTFGCLFLVEPNVQLFDVLPNGIGYLLIAAALKEIHVFEYRLESAMKLLYYGAGLSAARLVLMFFTFDMDSSAILSAVSIFGVAELIVLVAFFISFYGGLSYLAQRCESENVLGKIDAMRTLGIVFAAVHVAMTILPELTSLIELALEHDPDSYPRLTLGRLRLYKNYAIVLTFVISFIAGIWWVTQTLSFMKGVRKDSLFRACIEKRYGDYIGETPDEELYLSVKSATVLMTAGFIFCLNLRIYDEVGMDSVSVLPAWAGTLLLWLAIHRLGGRLSFALGMGAAAVTQFALNYLPNTDTWVFVAAIVIPLTIFGTVFATEEKLKRVLLEGMRVEIGPDLLKQRLALILHLGFSIAYGVTDIKLLHSFKVVFFILWLILAWWTFSAIGDEIKSRRKTH